MPPPDLAALLRMRIASEQARIEDLRRMLALVGDRRQVGFTDRVAAHGRSIDTDDWDAFGDAMAGAGPLVQELLATTTTWLLRRENLGGEVFGAAEGLLGHLTAAAGLPEVVLGHTPGFEQSDVVRASVSVHFPGAQLWDLPFLAHEFGHHLVPRLPHREPGLSDRRPLAGVLSAVARAYPEGGERAQRQAEELLADAVATVCSGHTYALACLCLRAPDGRTASTAQGVHPSWRERVATMCATLDALSETLGMPRFRMMRQSRIDPVSTALFGEPPAPTALAADVAQQTVETLCAHRPGLVYLSGDVAATVGTHLARADSCPPPGATLPAVLDAAWGWRMQHPGEDERPVAALALRYCREIAPGGAS
ncbi:hypothetical protein ACWEIJ_23560 [Lentzea sp. NPDC004789]